MQNKISKKALRQVEKGMMKTNRVRNIFAVLAIILTTFMITTIFSIGINYMENMELTYVRSQGSAADISLNIPKPSQEEQLAGLDYVKTIGRQYLVGKVSEKNAEGRELQIVMRNYDKAGWENHYRKAVSNLKGTYPEKEDEIMLSEDALTQLAVTTPELGMEIPLTYTGKDGEQTETFVLCGWFRSYTGTASALVSEAYCRNAGYTMAEDGIISLTLENMEKNFFQIQKDLTLLENQSLDGSVSLASQNAGAMAMVILLVLFIIGSGYLLIYNVLYISIAKDTRFYGLLKTIGTSPAQIKHLVKRQAAKFACIGIPAGILLATAVSFLLVPFVLSKGFELGKSTMDVAVFFHPSIFLLSIAFSAVTVWLSCSAPAKAAARISPVEALHYQSFAPKKLKNRKSSNGGRLGVMAFHNVFRDKKRAVLVFLSLFMGTATILGINGVIGSITGENFIAAYMDYDFRYVDSQFAQYEQPEKETVQLDKSFVEAVAKAEEVKELVVDKAAWARIDYDSAVLGNALKAAYEDSSYKAEGASFAELQAEMQSYAEEGVYGCYVSTIDEQYIDRYNQSHEKKIEKEAFARGETAVAGFDTESNAPNAALVGKALTLTADNEDGKTAEFTVGGAFEYEEYDENSVSGHRKMLGIAVPECIFVSEAGMARLTQTPLICSIGINVKEGVRLSDMQQKLNALSKGLTGQSVEYISSVDQLEMWNGMYYSMALLGNGAAVLLIVIGLINFVNVMLTGVIARKNEFAVMESIGTTKKQISKMLTLEGGYYAVISLALIMTVGNAFLTLVAAGVPELADYAKFEYPYVLIIFLTAAIFLICLTVPGLVYKVISRDTISERLHNFTD